MAVQPLNSYFGVEVSNDRLGKIDEIDTLRDDAILDVQKMTELIRVGTDSQRTFILLEFHFLLEHCYDETLHTFLPVLCEHVAEWSLEVKVASAEALAIVLRKTIPKFLYKKIFTTAFQIVEDTDVDDSFQAWGEILVDVLPDVQWDRNDELKGLLVRINEFAMEKDDKCRKLAARMFGSIAVCMSSRQVEKEILGRSLLLISDSNIEVRGMIAESLAFIGAALETDFVLDNLLPRLQELLEDDDERIHAATVRTIAYIIEDKREKDDHPTFLPVMLTKTFLQECEFARNAASKDQREAHDDVYLRLEIIAEVFGRLIYSICPFLLEEWERRNTFSAFLGMATCNGPIIRRYCAFNMPAVAFSLQPLCSSELSAIVEYLSRDPDAETRWNLAAGIHETVGLLIQRSNRDSLLRAVSNLLQDANPLVRMNIVEHFYELVESLKKHDSVSFRKLSPLFQNLTLISEGNWRTQEVLAKHLEKVCRLVPAGCIRWRILPLLYNMAEDSISRVRKTVMSAISKAIWWIPYPDLQKEAVDYLHSEWAHSGVYWMRSAFIDFCDSATTRYSSDLFRTLFADTLLQLSNDNVPNVRLKLAKMIHKLAYICQLEPKFYVVVDCLRIDEDPDVRDAIVGVDDRIMNEVKDASSKSRIDMKRREEELRLEKQAQLATVEARKTRLVRNSMLPRINVKNISVNKPLSPTGIMEEIRQNDIKQNEPWCSFNMTANMSTEKGGTRHGGLLNSAKATREGREVSSPRQAGRKLHLFMQGVGGSKRNLRLT